MKFIPRFLLKTIALSLVLMQFLGAFKNDSKNAWANPPPRKQESEVSSQPTAVYPAVAAPNAAIQEKRVSKNQPALFRNLSQAGKSISGKENFRSIRMLIASTYCTIPAYGWPY